MCKVELFFCTEQWVQLIKLLYLMSSLQHLFFLFLNSEERGKSRRLMFLCSLSSGFTYFMENLFLLSDLLLFFGDSHIF